MFKVMSYFVAFQAKVTEELAAATAQVSHLHLKMTAHQKKETELQVQLTESMKETDLLRGQLAQLQAELSGTLWRGLGLWPSKRKQLHCFLPLGPSDRRLMKVMKDEAKNWGEPV